MNWLYAFISLIVGLIVRYFVLAPIRRAVFDTFKLNFSDVPGLVTLVNVIEFIIALGAAIGVYRLLSRRGRL